VWRWTKRVASWQLWYPRSASRQLHPALRQRRFVDLDSADGRRIVERLVSRANVVISNYRAGVMAKLNSGCEGCKVAAGAAFIESQ
jgi:crotonobetainyl-CoA:carnitine CoA-transferase CaiB-like acyl-CoA transferase